MLIKVGLCLRFIPFELEVDIFHRSRLQFEHICVHKAMTFGQSRVGMALFLRPFVEGDGDLLGADLIGAALDDYVCAAGGYLRWDQSQSDVGF